MKSKLFGFKQMVIYQYMNNFRFIIYESKR